jgi:hypothetical protein
MKTTIVTLLLAAVLSSTSLAQFVELSGDITSDITLTNNRTYKLVGFVRVQPPATLNIQEGTLIVGDNVTQGTLIIKPGAKINANGTEQAPAELLLSKDRETLMEEMMMKIIVV